MIWGEIVNSVRSLHSSFFREFSLDPKLSTQDVELTSTRNLQFPELIDDFDEWDEFIPEEGLEDIIPLHPVERALVEGPLMPIQKIHFHSKNEIDILFASILSLEKEWCEKVKLASPDRFQFIENALVVQALKTSKRSGFIKLSTV